MMGDQAGAMLQQAMEAFGARDVVRAEPLVELDQVINRDHHGLARQIRRLAATSATPRPGCGRS